MNEDDKKKTIERYSERLKKFGVSQEALGWTKGRSNLRFEILLANWDLKGSRILDFGCGFGDLFAYVRKSRTTQFDYLGVDLNPDLIREAAQKYPEAKFICDDLWKISITEPFDYVVASGVFNHLISDNKAFIEKSFALFDRMSRRGFSANFLSDKVDYRLDHTYHANPGEIVEMAFQYSRNIIFRNDYMPFEFTVIVQKDDEINKDHTVFKRFEKYISDEPK